MLNLPAGGFAETDEKRKPFMIDRSARPNLMVAEMKEYDILFDTGTARKLVAQINRMAKEGWEAKSIGGLGVPTGIHGVYVLMEREVG